MTDIKERQKYLLVILAGRGGKALLRRNHVEACCGYRLPEVEIPRWQRTGLKLTCKIREVLSLETISLFRPRLLEKSERETGRESVISRCCVLEARSEGWNPPEDFEWVEAGSIEPDAFDQPGQYRLLMDCLEEAEVYKSGRKSGPFAVVGWFDELLSWAGPYVEAEGSHLTGGFQQHNGDPNFNLIRLETSGKPVWFKAANDAKWPEYEITKALSERSPRYFPKMLANRADWRAWLMEDIENRLDQMLELKKWKQAVTTLTDFQTELAGKTDYLLGIGCRDWRMARIADLVDPFIEKMDLLMRQQETSPPPVLTTNELVALGHALKNACNRMSSLGIPDSFSHGDFSAGNILADRDRCVLIDLAESYLGHPFLTFQYLLDGLHTYHPECDGWHEGLRKAYARPWLDFCSAEEVDESL